MNLILTSENLGNLILIIILLAACGVMFVLSYMKNKKYLAAQQELLDQIQVGSRILTKTFIYGTVEKITETTDGKIVLIRTGEGEQSSYIEMNIEGIYSIDHKEEFVENFEGAKEVEAEEVEEISEEK